jgi:hypothetical protein
MISTMETQRRRLNRVIVRCYFQTRVNEEPPHHIQGVERAKKDNRLSFAEYFIPLEA